MKLKQKLIIGFIAVSLLVGIVGFLGLYTTNHIINSFESGEEHFGSIIEASNEVSSYAKRAEGHAILFLTFHNETDRQKFFMRTTSLREQISIIDNKINNAEAKKVLDDIKSRTEELQSIGESLFKAYDYETRTTGRFEYENHEELIRRFDDVAAEIRSHGLELARIELDMKSEQERIAKENAANLYNIILILSLFSVFGALILGLGIAQNIANPILKLKETAMDIGKGNLDTRLKIESSDEIGELSRTFNKMAEDLLKSNEVIVSAKEYTDNIVNSMTDTLIVVSPHGTIQTLNPATCALLGYSKKELIGQSIGKVLPENGSLFDGLEHGHSNKEELILNVEKNYLSKDQRKIPVVFSASIMRGNDGKIQGIICVAHDITERKQAEKELQQSEEKYRILIEHIQDGVFLVQNNKIQFANEAFAKMMGYTVKDIIGKDFNELIVPEDSETVMDHFYRKQTGEGIPCEYEFSMSHKDGTRIVVNMNVGLITYQGKMISMGVIKDITRSRMAQEKILEQAALLDKARDAILVRDLEHRIIYCNKKAKSLYALADDFIGKNIDELLYKEVSVQLIEAKKSVIEKGEWTGELHQVTKDGRKIIVESRWTLMQDDKGKSKSILVINTDITGKKMLEEQFLRAQRMESIGTLASGIAHDFNNVLLPIMLSLELLKEKFGDDESQRLVNILQQSAKRGANLVNHVQSFARGVEGERKIVQVTHLISEIRQIAKETFPRSIEIRIDKSGDIWTVSGDATQLHQVLMNLCVNARDAMPEGGILSIAAENQFIDDDFARRNIEARVGPYTVISVSDTGIGVPYEIRDRIFEPFFTTKEHGKGTGLGLSTALGIVKSHNGFISVFSEVGKGTVFKVYLPAVTTTEIKKAEERKLEIPAGKGESILVVDDEPQIRGITRSILETHGYRALTANDGMDAITLYLQNKEEIKLVLMDMMMPVMGGPMSIQELRKINPDLKIIAVSGLVEKDTLTKDAGKVHAFLSKPYNTEKLLKTINEVLSAK